MMRSPSFLNTLLATTRLATAGAAIVLVAMPGVSNAQTRMTDPSTIDILDILVEKGVLTREDANGVLTEARRRTEAAATTDTAGSGVVRVPYIPQAVRDQIREDVKKEVVATAKQEGWAQPGALPGWLDRVSFSGDVRMRGEAQQFSSSNTPLLLDINAINEDGGYTTMDILPLRSTLQDRYRARVRARFAVDFKITDQVEAGVRFVTGNPNDPVSPNQTLTGNFDKFQVGFDRVFIRARPFAANSLLGESSLIFGKFDNPFFTTEMAFDRDLQFNGVAATLNAEVIDDAVDVFATAGAFPLEEFDFTGNDKYLFGGQIGVAARPTDGVRLKLGASLFEFSKVQGQYNTIGLRDMDYTAASRVQFGNSLFNIRRDGGAVNTVLFGLASKYRVGMITARGEFDVNSSLVAAVDMEGIKNFAFDRQDLIDRMVPGSSGDMGWHGRVSIGYPEMSVRNAWELSMGYRHLEADSTLDLFVDSDFGLGTDQEGFVIRGSWALAKDMWVEGSWFSARTLDLVDATGAIAPPVDTDTFMFDLNVRF